MVEYSICEQDNNWSREHTLVVRNDAVINVKGNCVIRGQLILTEDCHKLKITGDSLTIITDKKDVALGRRVVQHSDNTYSVSTSPLQIVIDCGSIKLRSGIRGFALGVHGARMHYETCFTPNCKNRDIPMIAQPTMRFLPGTEKCYCPPSYDNDELTLKRAETAGIALKWTDECKEFVHQFIKYDNKDLESHFLNLCYAKLFLGHTESDCKRTVSEWFSIATYLVWAYKFYKGIDFDYSLIRMSWLYAYKMEYMNYVQEPMSLSYMLATDMFYERRANLLGIIDIIKFIDSYKLAKNNSALHVTNRGIVLRNIQLDQLSNIVPTYSGSYNLVDSIIGGHTHILSTYGQSDKYCLAAVTKDVYEQFMSSMDIPTNDHLPVKNTEELEMVLNYIKYLGVNIPAPAMREQLPSLLRVSAKLLGFDEHVDEHGVNLMELWKDYVEHVDNSASEYVEVIEDYLHRVPDGSVTDNQVCELYKLCASKIQSMVSDHAQCSFLFTAAYSYDMANKMEDDSAAYAVYMWQACTALAQALLVATNIDIAHLAPADLFSQVNAHYHKEFKYAMEDANGFDSAYKQLLEFGREINWGM